MKLYVRYSEKCSLLIRMDKISNLPEEVITHILSFLPIKEAALTSLLSKRWRILFASSPNLHFLDYEGDSLQSFTDFVDRVLSVPGRSSIKSFSLRVKKFYRAHINSWICDVLNRGVLKLELRVAGGVTSYEYPRPETSLPFETFTCKTLVTLNLSGFLIDVLPEDSFLPALKNLSLVKVKFCSPHVCAFQKLLSACPVLEDLTLNTLLWEEGKWHRLISSLSLQRLIIESIDTARFYGSDFGGITFYTPNLTYLEYRDRVPDSYPIVNCDSLAEAKLGLFMKKVPGSTRRIGNPTNLIKGLKNVKIMEVSDDCLEMFYFFREAIPVFQNLFHLSVGPEVTTTYYWQALLLLLEKAPNLENLIITSSVKSSIHDPQSQSGYGSLRYSSLLSCPVKVLKITDYSENTQEMEHLKHFLGKLSRLELLEIKVSGDEDKFQISENLRMLPKASSECKINVI